MVNATFFVGKNQIPLAGNYSAAEVARLCASEPESIFMVWREGMPTWVDAASIPEISVLITRATPPPIMPPPMAPPVPPQNLVPPSQTPVPYSSQPAPLPPKKPVVRPPRKGCCLFKLFITVLIISLLVLAYFYLPDMVSRYFNQRPPKVEEPLSNSIEIDQNTFSLTSLGSQSLDANPDSAPSVDFGELTVVLPPGAIKRTTELKASRISGAKIPGFSGPVIGYDLTLGNQHQFDEPISISFPMGDLGRNLSAGTRFIALSPPREGAPFEPVPLLVDDQRKQITLLTTHLSPFIAYRLAKGGQREHSPTMKITTNEIPYSVFIKDQESIMSLLQGDPSQQGGTASLCWDIFNESFALGTNATALAENAAFMQGLESLNKYVPEIGMGLALIQLGMDLNSNKQRDGVLNFVKSTGYYAIAKKFPTRAMNIAMVGVFCIDYSLTTFGKEAWAGRKKLYTKIAKTWLRRQKEAGENTHFWRKRIYEVIRKHEKEPQKLQAALEASYTEYVDGFLSDELKIAAIFGDMAQTAPWSGGGGLNKQIYKDLYVVMKGELKQATKAIVNKLTQNAIRRQQNAVRARIRDSANYLNAIHTIRFIVEPDPDEDLKSLAGREVGLVVLDSRKAKLWKTKLDEKGRGEFKCTKLGFIDAGFPKYAYQIIPAKGDRKKEVIKRPFKLTRGRTIKVEFKQDGDFSGTWQGTFQIESGEKTAQMMREMMIKFAVELVGANEADARRGIEAVVETDPNLNKPRKITLKLFPDPNGRSNLYLSELKLEGENNKGKAKTRGKGIAINIKAKDGTIIKFKGTLNGQNQLRGTFAFKMFGFGPNALSGKWSVTRNKKSP